MRRNRRLIFPMPGVKVDFENSKVRAKLGLFVIGNGSGSPRAVIVWKLESTTNVRECEYER